MAQLNFTQQLGRFMTVPEVETNAADLRGTLDACFAEHPRLRGYVLDAQGHLREGQSFVAWRGGLPRQHCYDLVYRHGLAVSDDGQVLLMGSTTGGAWLSEDGGGQWQTISTTLPPIYAVRFA